MMKASIKFRDEQKPLLRAKVPIKILSFPFQSGVVAGESKELSLNLGTLFDSGPSFKFCYKPNNSQNPFSFVCKTGIGNYGSPNSSPFVMSAEFNLIGNQNPRFFIHFKPSFGDFLVRKSCSSSDFANKEVAVAAEQLVKTGYFADNGFFGNGKIGVLPAESPAAMAASAGVGAVGSLVSGMAVSARTVLPVGKRAAVNFKWGVRIPTEDLAENGSDMVLVGKNDRLAGFSFKKLPMLMMNKIGIEHAARDDSKEAKAGLGLSLPGNADVAEVCLNMKKQLEVIQSENGLLRKALDDLRSDMAAGKLNACFGGGDVGRYRQGEGNGSKSIGSGRVDRRSNGDKKSSAFNGFGGKAAEGDANGEEFNKAFAGASGA